MIDKIGTALKVDETIFVPVSNITLNTEEIILNKGNSFLLAVSIIPDNATRKNVIWVTDNRDVASITDGKITANSIGTATIYCISQDNSDILATCTVTVEDSSVGPNTISFNANDGYDDTSTMTTNENGKLSSLPTPTRNGYIFDGWYTAASGGSKITTDHIFTSNTTIYAHWIRTGPLVSSLDTTGASTAIVFDMPENFSGDGAQIIAARYENGRMTTMVFSTDSPGKGAVTFATEIEWNKGWKIFFLRSEDKVPLCQPAIVVRQDSGAFAG